MIAWTGLTPGSAIFALAPLFHITGLAFVHNGYGLDRDDRTVRVSAWSEIHVPLLGGYVAVPSRWPGASPG